MDIIGSERAFLCYSNRVLVAVLGRRLGVSFNDASLQARTVRLLWFLRASGGSWLSLTDLCSLGAGRWQRMVWCVNDGIVAGWVERIGDVAPRYRYRITALGEAVLIEADKYAAEEYLRSLNKVSAWRVKKGLPPLDVPGVVPVPRKKGKG